jgi:hypothetical protein
MIASRGNIDVGFARHRHKGHDSCAPAEHALRQRVQSKVRLLQRYRRLSIPNSNHEDDQIAPFGEGKRRVGKPSMHSLRQFARRLLSARRVTDATGISALSA